jgi:hypothetical protein
VRKVDNVYVKIFRTLAEAEPFLRRLATHADPWAFDIETYDAATPAPVQTSEGWVLSSGRKEVAVNPFHPDFRVRGVAIAMSPTKGAWIELGTLKTVVAEAQTAAAQMYLAKAFGSDAEKAAFNGSFDENGLIQAGWIPQVRNRSRDGMLGLVAMGDGTQVLKGGLTLQTAIQKLLRHEVYWEIDKSLMRDLPLEKVADGAVHDACYTYELCDYIDARSAKTSHIEWSKIAKLEIKEAEINYDEEERP